MVHIWMGNQDGYADEGSDKPSLLISCLANLMRGPHDDDLTALIIKHNCTRMLKFITMSNSIVAFC